MNWSTITIIEEQGFVYIVEYLPSRAKGEGSWRVKRIKISPPYDIKYATPKNNPQENINSVLTNYQNLMYNFIQEVE